MDLKLEGYSKSEISIKEGNKETDCTWYVITYNINNKWFNLVW